MSGIVTHSRDSGGAGATESGRTSAASMPDLFFRCMSRSHFVMAAQICDMIVVFTVAVFTYQFLNYDAHVSTPPRYILAAAAIGVVCHFGFAGGHLYDIRYIRDEFKAIKSLSVHWTRIFLSFAAIAALIHQAEAFSRLWFAGLYVGGLGSLAFERVILSRLYRSGTRRGFYRKTVAIVGPDDLAENVIRRLRADSDGIDIRGVFYAGQGHETSSVHGVPKSGNVRDLIEQTKLSSIQTVIIAMPHTACGSLNDVINQLKVQPLEIRILPESIGLDQISSKHLDSADFPGISLLTVADHPMSELAFLTKALIERILAAVALAVLCPLLLVCAAGVRINSPGPVLFRQPRVGYKGQEFNIFKFRTMNIVDVPNTQLTQRNDPRIFKFGSLLRKTSLDELPQLINVVKGDMALIGPRPHMPEARAAGTLYFDAVNEYAGRHRLKPGITGWAQVNGWRGPTDTIEQINKRVEHDIYYIENWSFLLDAVIICRTLLSGFFGKNAF